VLSGVVRSAEDCAPLADAQIEFWLANADGTFDDDHRATLFADSAGAYRFESDALGSGLPMPIHIRVVAEGFGELVTQHLPAEGQAEATLELVLIPTR
jgi:protocatechuate 3,4-dioxygenase beta subunit